MFPLSEIMLAAVGAGALVAMLCIAGWPWLLARRRQRIRKRAFPAEWRRILQRRVPYVRRLPADLQLQLKQQIQVFIAEKPFLGCNGLVVTDEMRVVVAAQACLLLLNRPTDHFGNLRQILLYPGAFVVDRVHNDAGGVLRDQRQVLAGESWSQGQVLLSWDDVQQGAAVVDDGRNVVIHEFAHQLDQADGHANGAPRLLRGGDQRRWTQVMEAEYRRLQRQLADGETTLLGDYAATSPAEFFAVASEVFFEQPVSMLRECTALYRELSEFYSVHPALW